MICVECGKESEIINNGLCINCYVKSNRFSKGPDSLDIIRCSNCNSYKFKNKWENESLNQIINKVIIQNFKFSNELKETEIKTQIIDDSNKYKKLLEVKIIGLIYKLKITENHEIQINIKREICDNCSKQFGGYHEAIIQIRADKRNLKSNEIDGIYNLVIDYVKNLNEKGNQNIFITDFEEKKNGLTFFLSDNNTAFSIIKKIKEEYSGDIKKSSKNIGMKDGKQIYRMTYLLRLYPFTKGDILSYDDVYYIIVKIIKNKIYLADLLKWGEKIFEAKDLSNYIIKKNEDYVKTMLLISQTEDEIQIMDKDNYSIYNLKKPKKLIFNEEVKTIKIQDKIFLHPVF
jgi:nonsense-mediated mRNA decay protein 3